MVNNIKAVLSRVSHVSHVLATEGFRPKLLKVAFQAFQSCQMLVMLRYKHVMLAEVLVLQWGHTYPNTLVKGKRVQISVASVLLKQKHFDLIDFVLAKLYI